MLLVIIVLVREFIMKMSWLANKYLAKVLIISLIVFTVLSTFVVKTKAEDKYSITIENKTIDNEKGVFYYNIEFWTETTDGTKEPYDLYDINYEDVLFKVFEFHESGNYFFYLTDGRNIVFDNIPTGVHYEVNAININSDSKVSIGEETTAPFSLKERSKNYTGIIQADTTVTFTNEIIKHDLKVKKETIENKEGEFNFTIKVLEKGYPEVYLPIARVYDNNNDDGRYFRLMTINEDITYDGKTYSKNTDYFYNVRDNNGDSNIETIVCSFFNVYHETETNEIEINGRKYYKNIGLKISYLGNDYDIYFDGATQEYTPIYIKYTEEKDSSYKDLSNIQGVSSKGDGVYSFKLKNSEFKDFTDILNKSEYEVVEIVPEGWTNTKKENDTGTLIENTVATFENKKDETELEEKPVNPTPKVTTKKYDLPKTGIE